MPVHLRRRRGLPGFEVRTLRRRLHRLLRLLDREQDELSVLFVDDDEMTGLNRTYRHKNRTTDVLAFSQLEGPGDPLHPGILGDVVISVPTARRQARARGHSLQHELTLLLVHGVLHLVGYEHEGAGRARAAAMRREQRRLLEILSPADD